MKGKTVLLFLFIATQYTRKKMRLLRLSPLTYARPARQQCMQIACSAGIFSCAAQQGFVCVLILPCVIAVYLTQGRASVFFLECLTNIIITRLFPECVQSVHVTTVTSENTITFKLPTLTSQTGCGTHYKVTLGIFLTN